MMRQYNTHDGKPMDITTPVTKPSYSTANTWVFQEKQKTLTLLVHLVHDPSL